MYIRIALNNYVICIVYTDQESILIVNEGFKESE